MTTAHVDVGTFRTAGVIPFRITLTIGIGVLMQDLYLTSWLLWFLSCA